MPIIGKYYTFNTILYPNVYRVLEITDSYAVVRKLFRYSFDPDIQIPINLFKEGKSV